MASLGAPIVDHLAPGLTDAQIDATLAPLQIDLPDELRRLWGWQVGVPLDAPLKALLMGPDRRFVPLAYTVQCTLQWREYFADPDAAPSPWKPHFLAIEDGKAPVMGMCDAAREHPVHLQMFAGEDTGTWPRRGGAESFGALVALWCQAIDCGRWGYSAELDMWLLDHARMPAGGLGLT